jgi:hypothetical protein
VKPIAGYNSYYYYQFILPCQEKRNWLCCSWDSTRQTSCSCRLCGLLPHTSLWAPKYCERLIQLLSAQDYQRRFPNLELCCHRFRTDSFQMYQLMRVNTGVSVKELYCHLRSYCNVLPAGKSYRCGFEVIPLDERRRHETGLMSLNRAAPCDSLINAHSFMSCCIQHCGLPWLRVIVSLTTRNGEFICGYLEAVILFVSWAEMAGNVLWTLFLTNSSRTSN